MKKLLLFTAAAFLLISVAYSQNGLINTFPWTEGFENCGTELPPGWEQGAVGEYHPAPDWNWAVVPAATGTPSTAHGGASKAQIFLEFFGCPVYNSALITPVFDLSNLQNPVLSFWHTQMYGTSLVYYKNSIDGEWTLLTSFVYVEIPEWTEEILLLPNPSNHYQIAFVGIFYGGIADIQLDDISITGETIPSEECEPISTFPWYEGFEDHGTNIPPCWEQELNGDPVWWRWNIEPVLVPPTATNSGDYIARIFLAMDFLPVYWAKLISPVFNLSILNDPILKFWHKEIESGNLSVFYKNSPNVGWTLLETFSGTGDWREEVMVLPNKSNHYQIAFGSTFYGGGHYEVQLDNISITGEIDADGGELAISSHVLENYSLTPNPVQDLLKITRSDATKVTVAIYNSIGALVHSFETSETEFKVNVSSYSAGFYLIRLSDGNTSATKRFIKR